MSDWRGKAFELKTNTVIARWLTGYSLVSISDWVKFPSGYLFLDLIQYEEFHSCDRKEFKVNLKIVNKSVYFAVNSTTVRQQHCPTVKLLKLVSSPCQFDVKFCIENQFTSY